MDGFEIFRVDYSNGLTFGTHGVTLGFHGLTFGTDRGKAIAAVGTEGQTAEAELQQKRFHHLTKKFLLLFDSKV